MHRPRYRIKPNGTASRVPGTLDTHVVPLAARQYTVIDPQGQPIVKTPNLSYAQIRADESGGEVRWQ